MLVEFFLSEVEALFAEILELLDGFIGRSTLSLHFETIIKLMGVGRQFVN